MTTINNGGPLINPQSIPPTWAVARIDECGRVQMGRQRSPIYRTGEFTKPYLRAANILDGRIDTSDILSMDFDTQDFESFRLKTGDVLVVEGGTVGRSAVYGGNIPDACFQNTVIRFQVDERLTFPKFADYLFRWYFYKGAFKDVARQTTIAHLGLTRFAGMPYVLPPLPEQRRIVEAIESNFARLDAAIGSLKIAKANQKAYRNAVLKSAYEGRLLTQDSRDEPASKFLERILKGPHEGHHGTERGAGGRADLGERLAADPSRLLPTWSMSSIAEVGEITCDGIDPRQVPSKMHIAPDNIEPQTGRLLECRTVVEDEVVSNNFQFEKGDVLYTKLRPYLNKVVVAPFDGVCSSDILPIHALIEPGYLAYWMLSPGFLDQVIPKQTGVTLPRISRKELGNLTIPIAPLPEQRRIVTEVERLFSFADEVDQLIRTELERAKTIRQSILKKAFEGYLVPQDPSDEPASALLERIKSVRPPAVTTPGKRTSKVVLPRGST